MPQSRIRRQRGSDQPKSSARNTGAVAAEPPTSEHWTLGSIAKSALLLAFIFLIVTPPTPFVLGPGLDSSWAFGLNMGHFDRMVFGRDIVFTYGPLGYLIAPAFPEAEPWAVFAFAWGIALVTAYALWKLCRHARHWTEVGLYLGVFWVYSAFAFGPEFERLLAAIIALTLAIAIRLDAKPWFDVGLLSFLSAVALLTKFNIGVIGLLLVLYCAAYLLWRHRTTLTPALKPAIAAVAVWVCTLVGLYWIADGSPGGLFAFLRYSAPIASGYSEAMAWAGPLWGAVVALISFLALVICVPLAAGEIRRIRWAIPLLIVIGFLCFKSAMVRQDVHELPFQFEIAAAALLVVAFASTPRSRIVVAVFALASLDLGVLAVTELWPQYLPGSMERLTGLAVFGNLEGFLHWPTTVGILQAATEQALAPDQLPPEFLPYVSGKRVSAYPWEIAMIRANHLKWQPLPVFQAYSAYTPALDQLNAAKLEEPGGPEEILLTWNDIDGRHPFYETPRSWLALLNWYDIQLKSPHLYLLHRRSTQRFGPEAPIGTVTAQWGQRIALPPVADDEALIMDADVRPSFKGILKSALLRSPVVNVHPTLRSGFTATGRVVRANMPEGVIVSDWPSGLDDLAPMLDGGGNFSQDRVVSIAFETPAPSEFNPEIRIQWSRVKLRQRALPEQPAPAPVLRLTQLWSPTDPLPFVQNAEVRREHGYITVRSLNNDPQCTFTIGPQLGNYKTIMIRAKYQVSDRIDLFFGRQIDGRGLPGFVRFSQRWIDAYFHVATNPYWSQEHGTNLRFDPVSERGVNSVVEISGIWGSLDPLPSSYPVLFTEPKELVTALSPPR
jgi:hypothetical protein